MTKDQTIHAGTTPGDDEVVIRMTDLKRKSAVMVGMSATAALQLAAELIHAANAVLDYEADMRTYRRELAEER